MWFMRQGPGKSLYIFLCTILGVMLFVVLQRSLALIHFILLNTNYQLFSFGLDPATLEMINYVSIAIAGFFGGWYGTWLGLHWHEVVYEKAQSGFKRVPQESGPAAKSTPAPTTKFSGGIKLVPIPEPKTAPVTAPAPSMKAKPSWNVDDLMRKPAATIPAVASKTPSRSGISRAASVATVTASSKAKAVVKKTAAASVKKTTTKKVAASAAIA